MTALSRSSATGLRRRHIAGDRGGSESRQVIDARRKVVMPGLIDGHGHAGHGLLKTLARTTAAGTGPPNGCTHAARQTEFWKADALLAGVERLKGGVTTSLTLFGGGNDVVRTDDPKYGDAYLDAIEDVGVRWVLAVGPRRRPFSEHVHRLEWRGVAGRAGSVRETDGGLRGVDQEMEWCGKRSRENGGRISRSSHSSRPRPPAAMRRFKDQARGARLVEAHERALRAGRTHARHGEVCG